MTQTDLAAVPPAAVPQLRYRTLRTIVALILREMTTSYGRSPGGYLWAVVQPVGMIVMLSVAFSLLLRSPSLGTSFILFYSTGILPLRVYQDVAASVSNAMTYNKALLGYPRVTYVDTMLARALLSLLTQVMVIGVVLPAIFYFENVREIVDFGPILAGFGLFALLGFGVGAFNCFMFLMFPLWKTIWSILTRPLMLFSAVLYVYEDLPRVAREYLWYNPLVHIMGMVRSGFYSAYHPHYISLPYVFVWIAVPMFLGMLLLRRHNQDLLFR
ncbi:capsular polysaccharide transport system permease protein [Salipiger thiooxidans]|uniref:Transport permease protein n=1 Tax=Salipiger thiooxidans TaxID=282683 RepID=A0A1G7N8E3_9RHOB|nr:ABC transporter permease [Salipiger thiooxidans]SDF69619.1 capsular polysaccharide transport system permease protein [Salipiger thiooxidans]